MTKKEKEFVTKVEQFFQKGGRHDLPWRQTIDPYHILVSEIMLQQTQVKRVVPKYERFIQQFPTLKTLSTTPLSEVLIAWQGLGYNRRAKMLHRCAQEVMGSHKGTLPKIFTELCALPGIGPYTAGAVMAFAYNQAIPIIETNIRTVFLYHFFQGRSAVHDSDILRYVSATLDEENPRQWYWALMDYGAFLKKEYGSMNDKSKHYKKQTPFKGSDREIRGAVVRVLAESQQPYTKLQLMRVLNTFQGSRIELQLEKLLKENLVQCVRGRYLLTQ